MSRDSHLSASATFDRLQQAIGDADRLESVYEAALEAISSALRRPRAAILIFDPDGVMRFKAARGLSHEYQRAVEGHTPWSPGQSGATSLAVPDVTRDESLAPWHRVFQREKIRGLAFVPLISRGGVIGKFMLYYARPHTATARELRLAEAIAQQVAFAVDRRRVEQDLLFQTAVLQAEQEAADDGILLVSSEGVIRYCNRRFAEMWDIPHDVLAKHSDPDAVAAVRAKLKDPDGFARRIDYLYQHPLEKSRDELLLLDGRSFDRYSAPVVGPSGELYGRVWFFRDTTEQKRAEAALRAEHQFRKAIEDSLQAGIAVVDVQGRQTYVNPAFCRMVGWTREELLGAHPPFVYWPPEDAERIGTTLRRVIAGQINSAELRFMRRSGERFDVLLTLSPLRGTADGTDAWLAAVTDITARVQAEQERRELLVREQQARAAAERANNAKDDFLAMLSHELRTPLNAVLGWTRMLLDGAVSPDGVRRALETIVRNADAQARLVNDILDVSRIAAGSLSLAPQPVDVSAVAAAALDTVRPLADAKALRIAAQLPPSVPAVADAKRLEQAIWNVLSNAVKFTPTGGRVDVCLASHEGHYHLEVRDTGDGIKPDLLPHVFERFRQGSSGSTRDQGGLGLGLAIVERIVQLHGGTVAVNSEGEGKGTTVTIRAPLNMAAAVS